MSAYIHSIATELPVRIQSNEELVQGVPDWTAERIQTKTGITERRIAAPEETAADLCFRAAERLITEGNVDRSSIDTLILCTQSPDYFLPTTACILQDRLGLPITTAAFDVTLGCSGYTYSLWLARSLLLAGSSKKILLLAGDTYSRYCHPKNLAVASLFGDGATASLLSNSPENAMVEIGPSVLGTNGRGATNLIVKAGGARLRYSDNESERFLFMNGAEIASFAVSTVKTVLNSLLEKVGLQWADIDGFVFHQANPAFIQRLTAAYKLPPDKVPVGLGHVGNTGAATIPMILDQCAKAGKFKPGQKLVLVGFGVGYSWAATYVEWKKG